MNEGGVPAIQALRLRKKSCVFEYFLIYSIHIFNYFDSASSEVILPLTNSREKNTCQDTGVSTRLVLPQTETR